MHPAAQQLDLHLGLARYILEGLGSSPSSASQSSFLLMRILAGSSDGSCARAPASHAGGVLSPQLWPGPSLATVGIWGLNRQLEELSFSFCGASFQIKNKNKVTGLAKKDTVSMVAVL